MEPQGRPRAAITTAHSTERTQTGKWATPGWEIPEGRKEMKTSRRTVWNSCTNYPNLKKSPCF